MIEIIKNKTDIKFTGMFGLTAIISSVLVLVSLFLIGSKLQYGVDFRGGAEVQVKFADSVTVKDIRRSLTSAGFGGASVQTIGDASDHEVLIKVQAKEGELNKVEAKVEKNLEKTFGSERVEVRKVDIVGPKAGSELRVSGFQAMGYALLAIMVYIGLRFDFKYSPGAIGALFHDVSIILGVFALTGTEFTLQTVAALLAVIGYSVNDTVIVYDRVRENEINMPGKPLSEQIDRSVNDTLSRTVLTSGTTLFISMAMYIFGGEAIKSFFFAITLGVVVGTYSSIFVAAPITLIFDRLFGNQESSTSVQNKASQV
jgi:preprotein translocase subunit SecF